MSVKSSQLAAANKPISCSLSSNFQISPFTSRRKGAFNLRRRASQPPFQMTSLSYNEMNAANVFNDAHSSVTYLFCTYFRVIIIERKCF
jgi:hypothetical protein